MTVSLAALLLVIGCAVAFSVADLQRKMLADRLRALPLLVAMSAGMAPLFLVWWLWQPGGGPGPGYWLPGLGSMALNLVANLAFLVAVRMAPLSLTIPVLSLTPVFTTLLAIPLLGEVPSARQLAGVALTVGGVLWLGLRSAEGVSPRQLFAALAREKGSQLMVVTALCWSLAMPLDKLALAASGPAFHGLALNGGVALGALVALAGRGRLGDLRPIAGQWVLLVWLVVIGALALVLILLAIPLTWIGFIETVRRGLGSFLAVLWGRLFFAERVTAHKLVAIANIAAGVALVSW